jgi:ribonuclease P protein component
VRQTFKKTERLKSKKTIERLFNQGRKDLIYPFKVLWLYSDKPATHPAQVLIAASSKTVKKATDRNKVKRRMREAYRRNKDLIYTSLSGTENTCAIAIIYIGKEIPAPFNR